MAAPASAQLGASLAIESDHRLRGYSLSKGDPALTAQLALDDPGGLYVDLSASSRIGPNGPGFLGLQANAGYAREIGSGLTVDVGLLHAQYRRAYRGGPMRAYSEAYVGLSARRLAGRLYYSPDYFYGRAATLYGEVEGFLAPAPDWRVEAHVGALHHLRTAPEAGRRSLRYDWRGAVSRTLGTVELHAALVGGGADYARRGSHRRTAITVGSSWSF